MSLISTPEDIGVSPVVGVVLMVAVTVLLSAAVGVFVFNLGQTTNENAQAGVTIDENANQTVTITLHSRTSADEVRVKYPNGTELLTTVGDSVTVPVTANESVSIIGVSDGSETVLQTYEPSSNHAATETGASPTLVWATGSDWDAATSATHVVHDGKYDHRGAGTVHLGYTYDQQPNLVAHWTFDEDSGSTATDVSQNNLNGTLQNGVTAGSTGILGTSAYTFDSSQNQHVDIPEATELPTGNDQYALVGWFKTSQDSNAGLLGWGNWGTENETNALRLKNSGGSGNVSFRHYWWGNDLDASTTTSYGSDWHFVVAQFDGTTRELWLDGERIASDTPTGHNAKLQNANLAVTNSNEFFNGGLDHLQVYNASLSDSRIKSLYNTTQQGSLTTATKSFNTSQQPDLQNLSYARNGGTITVTVTGSPGTASEEQQTVTLDGATAYNLTWTEAHTEYRVTIDFSTSDKTQTPTVSRLELG